MGMDIHTPDHFPEPVCSGLALVHDAPCRGFRYVGSAASPGLNGIGRAWSGDEVSPGCAVISNYGFTNQKAAIS